MDTWFVFACVGLLVLTLTIVLIAFMAKGHTPPLGPVTPTGATPEAGAGTPSRMSKVWDSTKWAFGTEFFAVLLAFAFLELALYRSGWLPGMFTWPGLLHLFVYPLGILAFSLADANVSGRRRVFALAMVIAGFAIFGLSHVAGNWRAYVPAMFAGTPSPVTSLCTRMQTFTLGPQPTAVNPRGFCSVATWLPADGCIYQQAARSSVTVGPLGNCAQSIGKAGPKDVEYMWSADSRILKVDVDLAPPHTYD